MSSTTANTPVVAPARKFLLPVSFAGAGTLLAGLLLVLIGCSAFSSAPGSIDDPPKNAVLCECTCDQGGPVDVPAKSITEGRDDAVKGNSTGNQYTLGGATVGLRFQQLNVPNLATINSATIQFTAAQNTSGTATLQIKIVNQPDVLAFGPPGGAPTVDFDTIPTTADEVVWAITDQWKANDPVISPPPLGNPEQTPNLKVLLQTIVNDPHYTPNSAVAFIIKGLGGTRVAGAFESQTLRPAFLTVNYTPHRTDPQQFLACADPADAADDTKAKEVCKGRVQSNVSDLANACHLANSCT